MIRPDRDPEARFHAPQPPTAARASLLEGLNPAQHRAVIHPGGPQLVLAGAGSGKTRVITHRIAWLIRQAGVDPGRIVAVTFTNKAADEMRERVRSLLGQDISGWIGTFHALCLRILRRDGSLVSLSPGFVVYDSDDQLVLVKRVLKEQAGQSNVGTPRSFLARISRAKNALRSADAVQRAAFTPEAKLLARVYRDYELGLREANAADFDDLLVRTLELFDRHPDVARTYASRCEHLLVDEYQDTNRPQYFMIRHLAAVHGNICVVGDEDQSIYRFRGAEIRNILDFERDHPETRTIRLEQNYRSTSTIIEAATALISHNVQRKGKTLWTDNVRGENLELYRAPDDRLEAAWVARRVRELEAEIAHEDMAVLYRTNAQSRQLEEALRRDSIPYQVVGSVQFYERKEIKDLLAYLKLAVNPADGVAFRRAVNTPSRGIGATTLGTIERVARDGGLNMMEAARHALDQALLAPRSSTQLGRFMELIDDLSRRGTEGQVAGLVEQVVQAVGYEAYLEKTYAGQATERMENVRALVSATVEFTEESEEPTLHSFLDRLALVSDADEVGERPGVTLMTVHCAKGLEFPVVFLAGLEENLFPHAMSMGSDEDLEEERRLCYVALTRARSRLLLSHAQFRRLQGALLPNPPSRFLAEIPQELVRETGQAAESFFDVWRGDARSTSYRGSGSSAALAAARDRRSGEHRRPAPRSGRSGHVPDGYAVGSYVLHPTFGGGQILDREGSGRNLKLKIFFADYGPKKILPAYTKLRVQTD